MIIRIKQLISNTKNNYYVYYDNGQIRLYTYGRLPKTAKDFMSKHKATQTIFGTKVNPHKITIWE